jgi:hypothetical protein
MHQQGLEHIVVVAVVRPVLPSVKTGACERTIGPVPGACVGWIVSAPRQSISQCIVAVPRS